jgi:hypothetical protein
VSQQVWHDKNPSLLRGPASPYMNDRSGLSHHFLGCEPGLLKLGKLWLFLGKLEKPTNFGFSGVLLSI